ncbi:hypothetical protein [Erythrobacter rubeus]|uniref:Uncharacterized protein n=1 Tax=Erythrobacter rubeus TaxID=2760803 RepID=A0ABR8KYS1_9SPHN|nr:hypothetical protein [Erythrobacter rubeus]MBD2843372.1 hypothetical protein [Erythrobacter rubeus]
MIRARRLRFAGVLLAGLTGLNAAGALAQEDDEPENEARDTVRIDILAPPPEARPPSEADIRECEEDVDAATVTGEIIVCRQIGDDPGNYYSGSRAEAQRRYAEETAFAGDILAPDVAGAGIFRGAPTVGGLCLIPSCPKDPALIIDVEALPDAPEGSDADRIARGLPPLEDADGLNEDDVNRARKALGLPPARSRTEDE